MAQRSAEKICVLEKSGFSGGILSSFLSLLFFFLSLSHRQVHLANLGYHYHSVYLTFD